MLTQKNECDCDLCFIEEQVCMTIVAQLNTLRKIRDENYVEEFIDTLAKEVKSMHKEIRNARSN